MPRLRFFLLVLSFAISGAAQGATRWVATCGSDAWTGLSNICSAPMGPKRTIQAAIDSAADGDTIFVLPGTYTETIDLDGKAIRLVGLAGADDTVIDGNGVGPVVTCNSLEGPDTQIEGFTITGGDATNGGGMFIALATPTIADCRFEGNHASWGGGLYAVTASPTVTGCTFVANSATVKGAGACFVNGNPTVSNCTFAWNDAFHGGGLVTNSAHATIEDCLFIANTAVVGGGAYSQGATATYSGCTFEANSASVHAGGLNLWLMDGATVEDCSFVRNELEEPAGEAGGGLRTGGTVVTVTNSSFVENVAPFGAGVHCQSADGSTFTACTFENNVSPDVVGGGAGGGMRCDDSAITLFACAFTDNLGNRAGGGIEAVESDITATWCGFHGNAATHAASSGGGIRVLGGALTLLQCTITGNAAGQAGGGGVHATNASVSLEGCTFESNGAFFGAPGGAVRQSGGSLELLECAITGNAAGAGGGVRLDQGAALSATDCTFEGNHATQTDGAALDLHDGIATIAGTAFRNGVAAELGGAVHGAGAASSLRFADCQFSSNEAGVAGGAIASSAAVAVLRSGFRSNSAADAGALALIGPFGQGRVDACRFDFNTAAGAAAAIMIGAQSSGSSATIVDTVVAHNTAAFGGGAILESALGGYLELVNSTVADNIGGGLRIDNGASQSVVANSIVWGNTSGDEIDGVMPTVRFSAVQGGAPGVGNLDANPLFSNPAAGNYALSAGSPCIDAGRNWSVPRDVLDLDGDGDAIELVPVDLIGAPRFADVEATADTGCGGEIVVDMGAYEHAGGASSQDIRLGDLNSDGAVDVADLLILLAAWGPCEEACCAADLDGDGMVGVNDLLAVLVNWG